MCQCDTCKLHHPLFLQIVGGSLKNPSLTGVKVSWNYLNHEPILILTRLAMNGLSAFLKSVVFCINLNAL